MTMHEEDSKPSLVTGSAITGSDPEEKNSDGFQRGANGGRPLIITPSSRLGLFE
jgi:hypothetical protein